LIEVPTQCSQRLIFVWNPYETIFRGIGAIQNKTEKFVPYSVPEQELSHKTKSKLIAMVFFQIHVQMFVCLKTGGHLAGDVVKSEVDPDKAGRVHQGSCVPLQLSIVIRAILHSFHLLGEKKRF
jgi:hypothetical protein